MQTVLSRLRFLLALALVPLAFAAGTLPQPSHANPVPHRQPVYPALDAKAAARIDALMQDALRDGVIPGAQLIVLTGPGAPAFRRAYGVRTLEPRPVPNDMSTVYELASLTKPLATAGAVMLLVQRGQLRLRDKLATYLPEFAQNGKGDVTIEQVLLHTSGIAAAFPRSDYEADRATILAHAYAQPLRYAPGTKFAYSNLGYILLAEAIGRITGLSFERFCARELFGPLGMNDSSFDATISPAERARLAPQLPQESAAKLRTAFGTVPYVNGHAGMLSNADDVARYARSLLLALHAGDTARAPLAGETVRAMIAPHYVGEGEVRGLGWDLDSAFSNNRGDLLSAGGFGHTGSSGTSLWIDPARWLAIVFISNAHYPNDKGSTVPLEGKIANVIAASLRRVDRDAVRAQAQSFDAAAARSAAGFPATPGPAPTASPSAAPGASASP